MRLYLVSILAFVSLISIQFPKEIELKEIEPLVIEEPTTYDPPGYEYELEQPICTSLQDVLIGVCRPPNGMYSNPIRNYTISTGHQYTVWYEDYPSGNCNDSWGGICYDYYIGENGYAYVPMSESSELWMDAYVISVPAELNYYYGVERGDVIWVNGYQCVVWDFQESGDSKYGIGYYGHPDCQGTWNPF